MQDFMCMIVDIWTFIVFGTAKGVPFNKVRSFYGCPDWGAWSILILTEKVTGYSVLRGLAEQSGYRD